MIQLGAGSFRDGSRLGCRRGAEGVSGAAVVVTSAVVGVAVAAGSAVGEGAEGVSGAAVSEIPPQAEANSRATRAARSDLML